MPQYISLPSSIFKSCFKIRTQWANWSLPIWTWLWAMHRGMATCQWPPHREQWPFLSQKPIQLHLVVGPQDPFYIFLRPIISQNLDSPRQLGCLANEYLEPACLPPLCASPPFWGELHFITQTSPKIVSTPTLTFKVRLIAASENELSVFLSISRKRW